MFKIKETTANQIYKNSYAERQTGRYNIVKEAVEIIDGQLSSDGNIDYGVIRAQAYIILKTTPAKRKDLTWEDM